MSDLKKKKNYVTIIIMLINAIYSSQIDTIPNKACQLA